MLEWDWCADTGFWAGQSSRRIVQKIQDSIIENVSYRVRNIKLLPNDHLDIPDVQQSDTGVYICYHVSSRNITKLSTFRLRLLGR